MIRMAVIAWLVSSVPLSIVIGRMCAAPSVSLPRWTPLDARAGGALLHSPTP